MNLKDSKLSFYLFLLYFSFLFFDSQIYYLSPQRFCGKVAQDEKEERASKH